jgi:hypothetical protein
MLHSVAKKEQADVIHAKPLDEMGSTVNEFVRHTVI